MKKVTLSIPHLKEGSCCQRARWLRRFGWHLNLTNAAVCLGELLALFLWDKSLPSWFLWVRLPVLFIILAIIFQSHRIAVWLKFLPQTPDPDEDLNSFTAFPKERRDAPPSEGKGKDGQTL